MTPTGLFQSPVTIRIANNSPMVAKIANLMNPIIYGKAEVAAINDFCVEGLSKKCTNKYKC